MASGSVRIVGSLAVGAADGPRRRRADDARWRSPGSLAVEPSTMASGRIHVAAELAVAVAPTTMASGAELAVAVAPTTMASGPAAPNWRSGSRRSASLPSC
jgi:hypothetical protein